MMDHTAVLLVTCWLAKAVNLAQQGELFLSFVGMIGAIAVIGLWALYKLYTDEGLHEWCDKKLQALHTWLDGGSL